MKIILHDISFQKRKINRDEIKISNLLYSILLEKPFNDLYGKNPYCPINQKYNLGFSKKHQ
ncbi:hypothetical protein PFAG_05240 [Plasmodium falciparum Santa Lucia]|uniref:Uncharacterized protein n=2 Tax=Plasmodium falciparum TaxID=5833 RepID=A0A024W0G6_PLAFA|nr:hypothetical protein PFTANZ_05130 [Plasmodium falciparum Tanzania (2000708)]EUT78665.1 hypothetical protein PFAG_05240 [Plasmodium falciparum Santa Lucia]